MSIKERTERNDRTIMLRGFKVAADDACDHIITHHQVDTKRPPPCETAHRSLGIITDHVGVLTLNASITGKASPRGLARISATEESADQASRLHRERDHCGPVKRGEPAGARW